jgi:hypothetical protein
MFVALNEHALATILADPDVLARLQTRATEIVEFLLEDCRRFGGCP